MTSNRNRKQAIRAYMAQHQLQYTEAARLIGHGAVPSKLAGTRWRRASQVLNVARADLPAALSLFAGRRAPSGPAAEELIDRLLEHLATAVPFGVLKTTHDLWEVTDIFADLEVIPPIPEEVRSAAEFVATLLSLQRPPDLRVAATQLGLTVADVTYGASLHLRRRRRLRSREVREIRHVTDDDSYADTWGDVDGRGFEAEDRIDREAEATVYRLKHHRAAGWEPVDCESLRQALALHLAAVGDVFLRVSEWQPATLTWRSAGDGPLRADCDVAGAPNPLSASITTAVDCDRSEGGRCELFGSGRRPKVTYSCTVGVVDPAGNWDIFARSSFEASEPAAKFVAGVFVAGIAAHRHEARSFTYHRLLVPRSPADGDTDAIFLDLGAVLFAVVHQHRREREHPPGAGWTTHPHLTADGDLASVIAMVFDELCIPWPMLTEPACQARVDGAEFQSFLTAQGIWLTELARCYFVGLGDAGPGAEALSLTDRHAAGMRAVLLNSTVESLIADLSGPDRLARTECDEDIAPEMPGDEVAQPVSLLVDIDQIEPVLSEFGWG
jgi:hypothetical protein